LVEDATSAYQETMKRGALSFMEPTVEKMNLAKWFVGDLYHGETVHVLLSVKL
jgi:4-hydroxyphenylpyruvate dioxygenase